MSFQHLFSGFSRSFTVPAGSLAKASSVGAKTVNGPLPFSVSTRSVAWTAATNVLKDPVLTAVSTISFLVLIVKATAITLAVKEFSAIQTVLPAKPGIQKIRCRLNWMPAYAGMTNKTSRPSIT